MALFRTRPSSLVVGIDLLPVRPLDGSVFIQGDFLSPLVRQRLKTLLDAPEGVPVVDVSCCWPFASTHLFVVSFSDLLYKVVLSDMSVFRC